LLKTGHNAPVTMLKLDPLGKILLSGDTEGRDRSIRLWELNSGEFQLWFFFSNLNFLNFCLSGTSLSVYTPPKQITACELTSDGKLITLALKNTQKLVTLQLCGGDYAIESNMKNQNAIFGEKENDGRVFNLNDWIVQ
jgi:WD40 repeat protein